MYKKIIFCSVLVALAFMWFRLGYKYFNLDRCHYDEGIIAYGATKVLKGDIPYKDFWTLYAPGHFYLIAGLFEVFGINVNVERISALVILTLISFSIYYLCRKLVAPKFALMGFIFTLIWLKSYIVYSRPIQAAVLFCILSLIFLLNYIQKNKKIWIFSSGILVSISTLFRQDFGFYILISFFILVLFYTFKNLPRRCLIGKAKKIILDETMFLLGFLIIISPTTFYFYINSTLKELIQDILIFTIKVYPKVRSLPYPEISIDNIIFYIPFLVLLITIIRLLTVKWNKVKNIDNKIWMMLVVFFITIGFFNYTRIRSEHSHLLPTMIPVILLSVFILDDVFEVTFSRNHKALSNFICGFIFLSSFVMMGIIVSNLKVQDDFFNLSVNKAEGFYDSSDLALSQMRAIKFIQKNTGPDEKIFVANTRHDKIVNSDVMFYFLSHRDSPTKYYELHPGVTDTKAVQKKIIEDLKKENVEYIIRWVANTELKEPNKSNESSKVFLLDNFINKNYEIKKDFGKYIILRKINLIVGQLPCRRIVH